MKIAVIGSGSWGTAISMLLADNGHEVSLWSHRPEEAEKLEKEREHKRLLPGIRLPDRVKVVSDVGCVAGCDLVALATPSFAVRATVQSMKPFLTKDQIVVCLTKGFDRENGYCIFADTIRGVLGQNHPVVALTGPSHAEEVGNRVPTAVVAASPSLTDCQKVQDAFMCKTFRVYTVPDIVGAQLGGALKNIIALAAGVCDGMGFGDNTKAALMTRGLTEMARLGVAMGGKRETFAGLSGLGDLIVTCTSMHSRNRRAGILIGRGRTARQAMEEVGAVVEGYYATQGGYELSKKLGIEMPVCAALYRILYEDADARNELDLLMTRAKRHESEEYWIDRADAR